MKPPYNVWMGYDPREDLAYQVARHSILSRTDPKEVDVIPLTLKNRVVQELLVRPIEVKDGKLWCPISQAHMATEFAISRFVVPFIQEKGWCLFVDSDIVCFTDIRELFAQADDRYAVMCVKHQPLQEQFWVSHDERCEVGELDASGRQRATLFFIWPHDPRCNPDFALLETLLRGSQYDMYRYSADSRPSQARRTPWRLSANGESKQDMTIWSADNVAIFHVANVKTGTLPEFQPERDILFERLRAAVERDPLKMDGQLQTFYKRKNWSSVMLINCDHPGMDKMRRFTLKDLNERPGRDLHAFYWLKDEEIGELEHKWNVLVGVDEMNKQKCSGIWHFTLGSAWFSDWKPTQWDRVWLGAKEAMELDRACKTGRDEQGQAHG